MTFDSFYNYIRTSNITKNLVFKLFEGRSKKFVLLSRFLKQNINFKCTLFSFYCTRKKWYHSPKEIKKKLKEIVWMCKGGIRSTFLTCTLYFEERLIQNKNDVSKARKKRSLINRHHCKNKLYLKYSIVDIILFV